MKNKQSSRSRKTKGATQELSTNAQPQIPNWFAEWIDRNRTEPLEKQWSTEEPEAILDYLHGNVADRESQAACYYEYARESETLRKARREYARALRRFRGRRRLTLADVEQSSSRIFSSFPGWVTAPTAVAVWQCSGYPRLPWRELTDAQQKQLLLDLASVSLGPVITDVRMLAGMKVFEKFEQAARAASKDNKPMVCPARVKAPRSDCGVFSDGYKDVRVWLPTENESVQYVVFTIKYEDGIDAVKKGISRWLDSEENQTLFKRHHKLPIDKQNPDSPVRYKELLKYLAVWRLYDELGFKGAKKWTATNRRRLPGIPNPAPFFSEKLKKTIGGQKHFVGPLYKDRREWEAARRIAQLFPARPLSANSGQGFSTLCLSANCCTAWLR